MGSLRQLALLVLWQAVVVLGVSAGTALCGRELAENHEGWKPNKGHCRYLYGLDKDWYNLDAKLDPRCYDIFAGLGEGRDRIARVHLTGWWKLRRVPNTLTEALWTAHPDGMKQGHSGWSGAEEIPENDVGLKERFWRADYDDSEWGYKFVPWDWNYGMGWVGGRRYGNLTSGVGWYRRRFSLGDVPPGHRVILHFEYVNTTSTVWVNGKQIGKYTVYEWHPGGWTCRGVSAEQHEYDITHAVRANADNQITVRVFDAGLVAYGSHFTGGTGGIWQPCWVSVAPGVYAETVHCTPRLDDSSLSLRCFMRSAFAEGRKVRLRVRVSPWRSYRYAPPVKGAPATDAALGEREIPPGRSEATFRVKLKQPVRWDLETPFLYHVQLYAEVSGPVGGGGEKLIGQARFGFREFKVDGDQFRLNGKRCFLPGLQINEPTRGNALAGANYTNWSTRWFESLRGANVIFMRWHSGHFPNPLHDTADEVGFFINVERLLPFKYEGTPAFAASVKRLIDNYYNHPSVIMYSFGNEHFSGGASRQKILKWSGALSKQYDLYRKYDASRPITCCSGSSGIRSLNKEDYHRWPKSDYHDNHDYTGGGRGHVQRIPGSLRYYREVYRTVMGGERKPYVNLECGYVCPMERRETFFDALAGTFPEGRETPADLDRTLYVDRVKAFMDPAVKIFSSKPHLGYEISLVGLGTYLHDINASIAYHYREMLDLYRIHGMEQVGFNLHAIDSVFGCGELGRRWDSRRWRHTWQNTYQVVRQGLQPIYAACPGLTRNWFAGKPLSFRLVAMNDSLRDLGEATVSVAVMDGKTAVTEKVIGIPSFTQERHHTFDVRLDIPDTVKTGHYRLALAVRDGRGKVLGTNDYRMHVLGKMPSLGKLQRHEVLIYTGQKDQGAALRGVLDALGVKYTSTRTLDELGRFGRVIVGPNAFDDYARENVYRILAFLNKGGRLLALAQDSYERNPIVGSLVYDQFEKDAASTTDVVLVSHPAFAGLERRDFHVWNGVAYPANVVLSPLTPAVLAATSRVSISLDRVGMSIGEIAVGKGAYLFSQVRVMENYDRDSVAARYAYNLIRYSVASDWPTTYAVPARMTGAAVEKFKRPDPKSCFFVDLRKHCNRSFTDEIAGDKKGGWSDDGAEYDMRVIPLGRQTFLGVPFEVIDPATNNGKSCVVLGGRTRSYFPGRADEIKIGRKVSHLYFLVASAWTPGKVGTKVGTIVFHYEEGGLGTTGHMAYNLVVGRNVLDWTHLSNALPEAAIAFQQVHPLKNHRVGALLIAWENPIPTEIIESISIISSGKAVPVLIAVTGATRVRRE